MDKEIKKLISELKAINKKLSPYYIFMDDEEKKIAQFLTKIERVMLDADQEYDRRQENNYGKIKIVRMKVKVEKGPRVKVQVKG